MEKTNAKSLVIDGIVFVMFMVIAIAVPFPRTATYWIALVFGVLAIGAQIYVMHTAFNKGEPVKSKFYGYPIARIGVIYLFVQVIASIVLMALGFAFYVPAWITLIVCVLVTGVSAIGFISADIMREEVERQDVKIKADVATMRWLQSKTASIAGLCGDPAAKKALGDLAEKFRYSDPVSSDATREIEADLTYYADDLQNAVVDGDFVSAKSLCARMDAVLNERNQICKLNK